LTNGKLFSTNIPDKPSRIPGGRKGKWRSDRGTEHLRESDPESSAQPATSDQAELEARRARKGGKLEDEGAILKSRRHYHSMLIKEINSVIRHLNSNPPRKYTFSEWSRYLKLIGEDESDPITHGVAHRKVRVDGAGVGTAASGEACGEEAGTKWSWLGERSPLMGNKGEAEWVLGRLTRTLEKELEAMKSEEEEGTGDWAEGSAMKGSKIMEQVGESGEERDWTSGGLDTESTPVAMGEDLEKQGLENG
jgi:potassium channel subfamily K, other eukaryote